MSDEIKRVSVNEIHQISEADLKRFEELYGIPANKTEDVEFEDTKVGITENDIKEAMNRNATLDELAQLTDRYMFEQFKAKQAKDAEFEIISPLQEYVNEGLRETGELPPLEDIEHEIIEPKQLTNEKE